MKHYNKGKRSQYLFAISIELQNPTSGKELKAKGEKIQKHVLYIPFLQLRKNRCSEKDEKRNARERSSVASRERVDRERGKSRRPDKEALQIITFIHSPL